MANALGELMDDARQVYVMGHSYADMDSLGAAAGVCCIARKRGRKCQIVIDTENNAAHPILRKLVEQPEYHGAFLTGSEAFLKVQPGTCWWWWIPTAPAAWSPSSCWRPATGWRLSTTTAGAAAISRKWP